MVGDVLEIRLKKGSVQVFDEVADPSVIEEHLFTEDEKSKIDGVFNLIENKYKQFLWKQTKSQHL